MANQEQVKILRQGFKVWNQWRSENLNTKIDLYQALLKSDDLGGIILQSADLREADLRSSNLGGATLKEADLSRANLSKANLTLADATGAILQGANLKEANIAAADLGRAILESADLSSADLSKTRLMFANLHRAILKKTNLGGADLTGANLSHAKLWETNLSEAWLIRTNLAKADLKIVNLTGAHLKGANLAEANIGSAAFVSVDLSGIDGLGNVIHFGASTIDTNTIKLSKGNIPAVFLRGCGLNDLEIESAKLANPGLDPEQVTDITYRIYQLCIGKTVQYYSCFIGYTSKDEEFARHLHDDLQNNGVRCWFAPEDMKIGDPIRQSIDRQIRLRDKLLVILSENSVKSRWVADEVEAALEEEQRENRLVLFPIRLDDAVMNTRDDWAAKIKRQRHIGNFSTWKDKSSYQKALERLLKDLKASGE